MLRCQDVLKTVGTRGEKRLRFFGSVCGMIVQDDSDRAFWGMPRVEVGQQADEFHAAVPILHARRDVAVLEIQRRQYRTGAQPLAKQSGIETPTRAQLAKLDRKRPKKGSNAEWEHPQDPDSKVAKMKDGSIHMAHKAEHAVDMETGAVVAVTVQSAAMEG